MCLFLFDGNTGAEELHMHAGRSSEELIRFSSVLVRRFLHP
jgi:hypothetical protein